METLLYLSLGLNIILLWLFVYKKNKTGSPLSKQKTKSAPKSHKKTEQKPHPVVNAQLRAIAQTCEAKLQKEDRGKVKLLVRHDKTDKVAILQIGELRISLCRNDQNQSMFKINSFMDALELAKDGYGGTARYIPVPSELQIILAQHHIINVYLEALGLEQISKKDDFWCVDTETGWDTGWKRFHWNVEEAFCRLHRKSKIHTSDGEFLTQIKHEKKINLLLLLKGWDYLFTEV